MPGRQPILPSCWTKGQASLFTYDVQVITDDRWHRYVLYSHGELLTYIEVLKLWSGDKLFRHFFVEMLAASTFAAFRWETPALTSAGQHRPFECVLQNSPWLAPRAQPEAFAEHFERQDELKPAVAFPNLGRNAILVVPTPLGAHDRYRHLAIFCREAPMAQQDALWQLVGEQMQARLGDRPVWLSTAGGGVSWLHVRLDDWPKYYGYTPYRQHT